MKRKKMLGYVVLTGLLALSFVIIPKNCVQAETFRMTIGAGHPADPSVWVARLRDFFAPEVKKRVEAATGHKIEWLHAYGGSVAKVGEVLEAVESGILDVGITLHPFEPAKLFLHNWGYYVPFASSDIFQVGRVSLKLHDDFPYLKEVFEKKYNQKWLGVLMWDSYQLVTTFPWEKVEQLRNRKIGGAGPNLPWVKAAGSIPVQMNMNEAYTSLQTGVYEGALSTVDHIVGMKLHEVARNFTFCDFGAICGGAITVNLARWNRLPAEMKKIMIEVGKEYTMDECKAAMAKKEKAMETLKKGGVRLYWLPFEERVRWANMMPNIPQEKAKEADQKGLPGTKVIRAYIYELEQEGYKFPRRWSVEP